MEFWILTFISVLSVIYCCDFPAIKGFEFLIHQKGSILYTVGCGFIATYVFYIIHLLFNKGITRSKIEEQGNTNSKSVKVFQLMADLIMIVCWALIQLGMGWYAKGMDAAVLGYAGSVIGGGIGLLLADMMDSNITVCPSIQKIVEVFNCL